MSILVMATRCLMRPKSAATFEVMLLLTLLIGAGQAALFWHQAIIRTLPGFVLTVQGVTIAFMAAMVLFVSRGHSSMAKWVLATLFGCDLPLLWKQFASDRMLRFPALTFLMTALQFGALMMLFLPIAQAWFLNRRAYAHIY